MTDMDRVLQKGMLYDFYGELLTKHQKQIYEDAIFQDMSLSEIAQEHGISRQGVHDLIKRCDKVLLEYEEKLHLVEKFAKTRELVHSLDDKVNELDQQAETTKAMHEIIGQIIKEL